MSQLGSGPAIPLDVDRWTKLKKIDENDEKNGIFRIYDGTGPFDENG